MNQGTRLQTGRLRVSALILFMALILGAVPIGLQAQTGREMGVKPGTNDIKPAPHAIAKVRRNSENDQAAREFAATITAEDLQAHLGFLASDALEGRETGEQGQKVAGEYLAAQFARMGLQPGNKGSWFQEYELNRVTVNAVTLSFDGKKELKAGRDFVYYDKSPLGESFSAGLVFAGFGIKDEAYDNLKGLDLKDKAVLITAGEPEKDGKYLLSGSTEPSAWGEDTRKKVRELSKTGAKMVLIALEEKDFKRLSGNPWIRHMMQGKSLKLAYQDKGSTAVLFISDETADMLLKKSKKSISQWRTALSDSPKVPAIDFKKYKARVTSDGSKETIVAENVLGFLEGTDKKDEVLVLTAHYDHLGVKEGEVFNGADDDGTGTASIVEIAEAFALAAKNGHRPRRSILFMPVSGEEKGLLGSAYYSDHPVYPLENTVCNLNIDMIGRTDKAHDEKGETEYVYIIGSNMLSTELHAANEAANKKVTQLDLDYTYNDADDPNRFYYRSDHYNFAKYNVPVIFYFTGVHADYHKSTDTIDKIMFPKTAKIAQLVFATAWEVANREKKLEVDVKDGVRGER